MWLQKNREVNELSIPVTDIPVIPQGSSCTYKMKLNEIHCDLCRREPRQTVPTRIGDNELGRLQLDHSFLFLKKTRNFASTHNAASWTGGSLSKSDGRAVAQAPQTLGQRCEQYRWVPCHTGHRPPSREMMASSYSKTQATGRPGGVYG